MVLEHLCLRVGHLTDQVLIHQEVISLGSLGLLLLVLLAPFGFLVLVALGATSYPFLLDGFILVHFDFQLHLRLGCERLTRRDSCLPCRG